MQAQSSQNTQKMKLDDLHVIHKQPPYSSEIVYPHEGDMIPTDLEKQKYSFVITNHSRRIIRIHPSFTTTVL